jgi:RNA polymerase sigma factor (sigma-70 family)
MAGYRLEFISSLARQMAFAPSEVRIAQISCAETLLYDLDPAKSYPQDFIVFRVTGYQRRGQIEPEQFTGLALFHDLGVLIEQVSASMNLVAAEADEPVLAIDDVTERFNVTSKTIQRWRRKGLVSRRFIFPDGKKRVGFLLSSIERFIARHVECVVGQSNLLPLSEFERSSLIRHAERLIAAHHTEADVKRRLARKFRRSQLTVLHTLRRHEQLAGTVLLSRCRAEPKPSRRAKIVRAARRGVSLLNIARRYKRPRATIYRIIIEERVARMTRRKVRFHDDTLYHQDDAERVINQIVAASRSNDAPSETSFPRGLPPYLAELYRTPLLTRELERSLFLKFHFLKFRYVTARRRFDPETARCRQLAALERIQKLGNDVKNEIVRANLRLVVSVARKHLGPANSLRQTTPSLMELVSEGNVILMRAAESFDIHKNVRFSTYATLALMKGFARIVPELRSRAAARLENEVEIAEPHRRSILDRLADRDEVSRLMEVLSRSERSVIARQFGIDGQPEPKEPLSYDRLGEDLGISKHRVRALEQSALSKLREAIHVR